MTMLYIAYLLLGLGTFWALVALTKVVDRSDRE
jgi:hypothetical protein